MKNNGFNPLYRFWLWQIKSFEEQLERELPHLACRTTNARLKRALFNHCAHVKNHVDRAFGLVDDFGMSADSSVCVGMACLIRESNMLLHEMEPGIFLDYAIIGAVQKMVHYEIATYGPALSFARLIGRETDEQIISSTLEEEYATSDELTGIGEAIFIDMDRFVCGD